jgi:protein gp37
MLKTPRLSKSGIEYLEWVWNFYSGCRHKQQGPGMNGVEAKCPPVPCWAEELTGRFKDHYPQGFKPTFYPEAFLSPLSLKKPARIGVCFMGDLFGDWVDPEQMIHIKLNYGPEIDISLIREVKFIIKSCWQHTFIFLTKNPAGMLPWSPFPDNCEIGYSAWSPDSFIDGLRYISQVEAKVKWCSLEPLLEWNTFVAGNAFELLDWMAIGALTGNKKQIMELGMQYPALTPWKLSASNNQWGLMPTYDWIKNIVVNCDGSTGSPRDAAGLPQNTAASGTKVFLKDNLYTWLMECPPEDRDIYWADISNLRQDCGAREKNKAGV